VAVVVSEETGSISIAAGGEIERDLDGETLRARLYRYFQLPVKAATMGLPRPEAAPGIEKSRAEN